MHIEIDNATLEQMTKIWQLTFSSLILRSQAKTSLITQLFQTLKF